MDDLYKIIVGVIATGTVVLIVIQSIKGLVSGRILKQQAKENTAIIKSLHTDDE